jgi:hypothetical protein
VALQALLQFGTLMLWGLAATIVMTILMSMAQELRLTRMSFPFMLGTAFTPDRDRAQVLGFVGHLLNGLVFAFFYAFLFETLGRTGWLLGLAIGLVHGLFMLSVVIPTLPALHPRMASERQGPTPTRQLQPPGFLAMNYGWRTPIVTLIAHGVYGAILGGLYRFLTF